MTGALELNKKRMSLMLVVVGVAMILALAGAYGAFAIRAAWGLPVFIAALVLGFGAQLWFIMGIVKGRGS
jgi:uncharacterized protein YhdP